MDWIVENWASIVVESTAVVVFVGAVIGAFKVFASKTEWTDKDDKVAEKLSAGFEKFKSALRSIKEQAEKLWASLKG